MEKNLPNLSGLPPVSLYVGISLLLHALLATPILGLRWFSHTPPHQQQLVLDLDGLINTRQTEAQNKPQEKPISPTQRKSVQQPTPQPEKSMHESPVPVAETTEQNREHPNEATPLLATPHGEENRIQQTIQAKETDEERLRKYLINLRKAIISHLAYPAEARQNGLVGSTVICFTLTESGEILPNTLVVHRSSGSPLLDANAIKAAQAAVPFPAPPRQMDVKIGLSFVRDI